MSFRTRLLVVFLLAVLVPMVALALFVRVEMTNRLADQYERRVESLVEVIEEDLAQEGDAIEVSLAALRRTMADDNRFRRAAVDRAQDERRYLLDYAGTAMRLTGLSMLQIQDQSGRIVSSGHFRNEYDRIEPELPALLASVPGGIAFVRARTPDSPFVALARAAEFQMGNERFTIVAGVKVERRFLARLAREAGLTVSLAYPGGRLTSDAGEASHTGGDESTREGVAAGAEAIVRELALPFADAETGQLASASIVVSHELAGLRELRRSIDVWFLVAVAATAVLAVILVSWLASRISKPLVELADKTSRIDLDRLDIDFASTRRDEIGALSRLLGAMTNRLRVSAARIRDAERRATLGELARQVNHDIKNGLTPIRNVIRHLAQLGRDEPARLPDVFRERQSTLDSSVTYLENLASNYARLNPKKEHRPFNVNEIARQVSTDVRGAEGSLDLRVDLCDTAVVEGDPLSLRRVLENLVGNAVDSLESGPGSVALTTEIVPGGDGGPVVRIVVSDTGPGMTDEQMAMVFDDFYTTKSGGTGLGLSIVRRLVMDLEGSIRVESEEGKGSRFIVDLPGLGEFE